MSFLDDIAEQFSLDEKRAGKVQNHMNTLDRLMNGQRKSGPKSGSGENIMLWVILLFIGLVFGIPSLGFVGVLWSIFSGVMLVISLGAKKKKEVNRAEETFDRAPSASVPVRCDNPEPHRHYEAPPVQAADCQNQEMHRHFEQVAPGGAEKRRENLRRLYEAGLYTKEEYDEELKRLR